MNNSIVKTDFLQEIFQRKSQVEINILNYLIVMGNRFDDVYVSQQRLATRFGVSRRYINSVIASLAIKGFITKTRRFNKTSIYTINTLFYTHASYLKNIFWGLAHWSKRFLLAIYRANFSLSNKGIYKYNNRSFKVTKKRKEYVMQLSPAIIQATAQLGLTDLGQKKLAVLPDDAIIYALKQANHYQKYTDPFKEFFKIALDYATQHKLPITWAPFYNYVNNNPQVATGPLCDKTKIVRIKQPKNTITDFSSSRRQVHLQERTNYYQHLIQDKPNLKHASDQYLKILIDAGIISMNT